MVAWQTERSNLSIQIESANLLRDLCAHCISCLYEEPFGICHVKIDDSSYCKSPGVRGLPIS